MQRKLGDSHLQPDDHWQVDQIHPVRRVSDIADEGVGSRTKFLEDADGQKHEGPHRQGVAQGVGQVQDGVTRMARVTFDIAQQEDGGDAKACRTRVQRF